MTGMMCSPGSTEVTRSNRSFNMTEQMKLEPSGAVSVERSANMELRTCQAS